MIEAMHVAALIFPSSRPTSPVPRLSSQGTPEALPYPILRRLSSISESRAAPRCGCRKSRGQGVAVGATVALLLARSLAADWVAHRLGRRVHEIKAGSSAKAGAVWPVCGSSP